MGAPLGNTNSADGKRYRKALERALAHKYGSVDDGLFAMAQKRVEQAEDGNPQALEHIAERFDGKPAQAVGGSDDLPPIKQSITVDLVKANA